MPNEKKIWFPAKRYGYGWGLPCCRQGWVVLIGYILLVLAAPRVVEPENHKLYLIAITAGFIAIVIWKGGRPRWRWGK